MRIRITFAALLAASLLAGCGGTTADGIGPTNPQSGNNLPPAPPAGVGLFKAVWEFTPNPVATDPPLFAALPYPTDFYFLGSTDGTLGVPNPLNLPWIPAVNALDGFSTLASATARFSRPILASSISGATMRMIEVNVDNATKATLGVRRVLVYGTDYTARVAPTVDSGGTVLEIVPLKPLTPSTGATNVGYLIVLTNGLRDTANNAATPDSDYLTIRNALPSCSSLTGQMNLACQLTAAHFAIAGAVGVPAANVVLAFSFSTQSTRDTLNIAALLAAPTPIVAADTGLTIADLGPLPPVADVYVGTLRVPYYLSPTAPLTGSWRGAPFTLVPGATPTTHLTRFNPVPVGATALDIPLFVTVPNTTTKPLNGWPVVIFQHGLQSNRTTATNIAAAYAQVGFAVAAIDAPLHGLPPGHPFYQAGRERTFNIDALNNTNGALAPDGVPDPSGTWFLNIQSFLTSRDNFRQAELDLVQLARSLPGLDLDGGGGDIDASRIHYAGISLGGILGTVASALPAAGFASAYLNVPAGGLALLAPVSPTFSARFNPALAASNPLLTPGLTLYDQFWRDLQNVADSADPANYVAAAVAARPVVLTQVIGDIVLPNSATQRLVGAGAFAKVSAAGPAPVAAGSPKWVNFTSGVHSSLLDFSNVAVTTEMQTHAASLVFSGGTGFTVVSNGLLEP